MKLVRFSGYSLMDDNDELTISGKLFHFHTDDVTVSDDEGEILLGDRNIDLAKLEEHFVIDDYDAVNNDRIVIGGTYTHFKGKSVTLITLAKYSENPQMMFAIYSCENGIYARLLDMFLSEVDHDKYPNVHQKYRFELRC